ncbi:hypothetical protein NECAME_08659 [Necator americanus]|uniref:Peptidase M13 N-terminal domain-containing protein n=1 Tax=Necator americanus TaxID=51031 RepID=W2TJC7_NECAM|nr:hypothetical protein NECAME_08659 [Necator americanus]ETN81251.1 hypothetical protein NECAME_08659 [Necator americanus]
MLSVVEKVHRLRLLIAQEDEDEDEDRWYRLSELDVKLSSATEKIVEKLTREIFASFKERIKENKWMTREQKEFAILKAERMKSHVAYEDVHFNETELDNRHKDASFSFAS